MPDHRDIVGLHQIVVAPQRPPPKKDRRQRHQTDALKKQATLLLARIARMVAGNAQNGVAPRVVLGDLRSTSWFRGF